MFTRSNAEENPIAARSGRISRSQLRRWSSTGHAEWVFETIQELRPLTNVTRVGVWFNEDGTLQRPEGTAAMFRGEVWDEAIENGVLEWNRLTVDVPLPVGPLNNGLSCEYEIEDRLSGPILGPQLQLRRVLWVPVIVRHDLRGLVMVGSPNKHKSLPCADVERVACRLELLLELEEERRLAACRKADMDFWLRIKGLLADKQSANMILGQLAESCTRGEAVGGTGAVFALIGERKGRSGTAVKPLTGPEDHLEVRAQSGDAAWAHGVNGGPLEAVWWRAIETGHFAVAEADPLPLAKDISRIIAVPVEVENELAAVLLAGLPKKRATLEIVNRLNWRGALAGEAFEQERRNQTELPRHAGQRAHLESYSESQVEQNHECSSNELLPNRPEALQQAIEWLEEGLVLFDDNEQIVASNGMLLRLLGIAEGERRNLRNLESLIRVAAQNAADPKRFASDWRALSQDCLQATQEELAMLRPVAQSIERYARPIVGATGKKVGRVEVYRGQPALRNLQSKMALTENLASLGQRVTQILHELKNPLTTILGNAQRLAQPQDGETPSVEAAQILREAERASGIVRQLLNVPRDAKPEMRLVSIAELVANTAELQRSLLANSTIRLKTDLQESLPRVYGDYAQLQQALMNLLENAQQAIQDSGVGQTITVRALRTIDGRVRVEVQDDGPGIPDAIQSRIFDPFFTTKPPGKGTGLGLAIVSGFVRENGGTIGVFSEPEKGARFVIELPAADEDAQMPLPPIAIANAALESLAGANGEAISFLVDCQKIPRVLVVEDEPTVAALVGDVLREAGMEVDVLTDCTKALQSAQRTCYDLAVCDVKMPGMDGQQFFAALEKTYNPLRKRMLFVTGDGIAPRTHEFLMQHNLPYLAKPFRVEELCQAVNDLLRGERHARELGNSCGVETSLGTGKIDEGNIVSTD